MRIRFLIQILGWIWSFFLKLGPSEILGCFFFFTRRCHIVVENEEREKGSRPSLGIQSTLRPVPATGGAVSQSGSINLSAYPSKKKKKNSSGAPESQSRALARAQRAWGEPAGAKYTQMYTDWNNTRRCTYHSQ